MEHVSPFDAIRQIDEARNEYWSARDLTTLLTYSTWQKFTSVIRLAQQACDQSGQRAKDHFNRQVKIVSSGSGAQRGKEDYRLSRYACYLIVQNADPNKPIELPCGEEGR